MYRISPRVRLAQFALPLFIAAGVVACSDTPTGSNLPSALSGLSEASIHDSTGTTPPAPGNGSGQVHGTVLAPSVPGSGNDSLETAPRIAGAIIKAYPVTSSNPLTLADPVASVTTDAEGRFELPELPGGEYVVTVEPPAQAAQTYHGQWLRGPIGTNSGDYPWWVVLAKR